MVMFKGIEDGGTNGITDTEDGIELQPLTGLDDFGSIFAWARGAARSVGTTARSGAASPFDLMPASLAKGAIHPRPAAVGHDLPFNTPRSYLSGFSGLEETITFDVPVDGVMDDGMDGLGKINLKKKLKQAQKFAKKNPLMVAAAVATAPFSIPAAASATLAMKAAPKIGRAADRAWRRAPTPLKFALAPMVLPTMAAGRLVSAAGEAGKSLVPSSLMHRPTSSPARAAAQAAQAMEQAVAPPENITVPTAPSVTSMMTADASQAVDAAMAKVEKDPFNLASRPPTRSEGYAVSPSLRPAPAAEAPGRRDRDPFAVPSGQQAAPVTTAETMEQDEAAYADAPEAPPAETPPEEYANAEAITDPEIAEPDVGISPADESEPMVVNGLGVLLGLGSFSAVRARKRLMARVPTGWLEPRDLLTKQGASYLGVAGAKAALAAKLHGSRSKLIEQRIERLAREGRGERDQVIRDRKAGEALSWARELLKERASEARAARVAAGAQVALRFRAQAATASTEDEQKKMLGLAAGAIMATQTYAKTKIPVKLPAMLAQSSIDKLRNASARPAPTAQPTMQATLLGKVRKPNPSRRGFDVPQALTAFGRGDRPANREHPALRQSLPLQSMPQARFASQYAEQDEATQRGATLFGLDATPAKPAAAPAAGKGTWDFLNSIKDVATQFVGNHTAAGAALRGDYATAAAKAAKAGQQYAIALRGGKAVATGPSGQPLTADEQAVLNQIDQQSGSFMGQTLPILAIAGVGAAGLIVFLMRRKAAK